MYSLGKFHSLPFNKSIILFSPGVPRRLTLGLMGLDELHLRVLATSSENLEEKRNAQRGAFSFSHLLSPILIKFSAELDE